uniref:Uncharacterized protein n=1 Tax=Mustela putorius furo TaxID=9669 RepID=M3YV41_MUSPF
MSHTEPRGVGHSTGGPSVEMPWLCVWERAQTAVLTAQWSPTSWLSWATRVSRSCSCRARDLASCSSSSFSSRRCRSSCLTSASSCSRELRWPRDSRSCRRSWAASCPFPASSSWTGAISFSRRSRPARASSFRSSSPASCSSWALCCLWSSCALQLSPSRT